MSRFEIIKERTVKNSHKVTELTSDCWYVIYINDKDEILTDLVKSSTMSEVFDYYYDKGVTVKEIVLARGHLNPKMHKPKIK